MRRQDILTYLRTEYSELGSLNFSHHKFQSINDYFIVAYIEVGYQSLLQENIHIPIFFDSLQVIVKPH